jgi:5-deoxy-glucuronate isomerase
VIAERALPNALPADQLRLTPDADGRVSVDPARAGWRYLSFESMRLADGQSVRLDREGRETCVVVIGGGGLWLDLDGGGRLLEGRSSPLEALPWAGYLPVGVAGTGVARAAGGSVDLAVARAPGTDREGVATGAVVITPEDVRIEVRGAGNATRQINHIITPDFPADRLELVEVLTPSGNWSSWPPHKHDVDAMPDEAVLEEIYHYAFARPEGWGVQRLYRRDGTRDALWAVREGDVVLVTDGYHPFVAAHGYDAYYLNVLAGDRRTMACTDDPDLAWTRGAWSGMAPDPRVPLVAAITKR